MESRCCGYKENEQAVYEKCVSEIGFENGRYVVKLLFNENVTHIDDNFELSLRIRMFVCLSVGYTLLIKPNSIHMLYMGRSGIYRGRFLSEN